MKKKSLWKIVLLVLLAVILVAGATVGGLLIYSKTYTIPTHPSHKFRLLGKSFQILQNILGRISGEITLKM